MKYLKYLIKCSILFSLIVAVKVLFVFVILYSLSGPFLEKNT